MIVVITVLTILLVILVIVCMYKKPKALKGSNALMRGGLRRANDRKPG